MDPLHRLPSPNTLSVNDLHVRRQNRTNTHKTLLKGDLALVLGPRNWAREGLAFLAAKRTDKDQRHEHADIVPRPTKKYPRFLEADFRGSFSEKLTPSPCLWSTCGRMKIPPKFSAHPTIYGARRRAGVAKGGLGGREACKSWPRQAGVTPASAGRASGPAGGQRRASGRAGGQRRASAGPAPGQRASAGPAGERAPRSKGPGPWPLV